MLAAAIDTCITNVLFELQKKRTVCQERSKQKLVPLKAAVAVTRGGSECVELSGRQVGQSAGLQIRPDILDGIEVGGIRREEGRSRPQGLPKYLVNPDAAMSLEAIPNHNGPTRQVAAKAAEKLHDLGDADISIWMQPEEQRQLVAARWDAESGDCRDLLMRTGSLHQHRRLAMARPASTDPRGHQETALVDKNQRCIQATGFFLTRGHSCLIHV